MADTVSRLRQRLRETQHAFDGLVDYFLAERGPLIRGTFGTRARICGNPGCKCVRGELHVSKFLGASQGGKVRQVHVPVADELRVAEGVERYRRYRQAQAHLAERLRELVKRQLELVDSLGKALLEPYPPDRPLPPAKRRGRPPKAHG